MYLNSSDSAARTTTTTEVLYVLPLLAHKFDLNQNENVHFDKNNFIFSILINTYNVSLGNECDNRKFYFQVSSSSPPKLENMHISETPSLKQFIKYNLTTLLNSSYPCLYFQERSPTFTPIISAVSAASKTQVF